MATILVVDDSAVDRNVVRGLLEKGGLEVACATNGVEAIESLAASLPDLVLTDLIMPEMDGLELVAAVRSRYPLVPVILMTSRGSEDIAVRALRQGASSYVPKRMLAGDLLDTVRSVLAVSSRRRGHTQLMECMARSDCAFVLANDCSLFDPLIAYLQEEAARLGICDETERTRIGMALAEALSNALLHGNLEIASDLAEADDAAAARLLDERRAQEPYRSRRIHIEARLSRDQAVFVVRDDGRGFDPDALPDPTDPANLEHLNGRGVLLMRTFMDQIIFNDAGNSVTLIKRRAPDAARHT